MLTFHTEIARNTYSTWYSVLVHYLFIKESCHKTEIICMRIQTNLCINMFHVHRVSDISIRQNIKCCRKFYKQSCKIDIIHITGNGATYNQWIIGPSADKYLWHTSHKAHQILFTKQAIHSQIDLSRSVLSEGIKIHLEICRQFRIGSSEPQCREKYFCGIQGYRTSKLIHLYTTFFFNLASPHLQIQFVREVIQRIYTYVYIRSCYMIIIKSFGKGFKVVVIFQTSMIPVQRTDLI